MLLIKFIVVFTFICGTVSCVAQSPSFPARYTTFNNNLTNGTAWYKMDYDALDGMKFLLKPISNATLDGSLKIKLLCAKSIIEPNWQNVSVLLNNINILSKSSINYCIASLVLNILLLIILSFSIFLPLCKTYLL
jgi:hypothetical protein